jgi:hypothetical protein
VSPGTGAAESATLRHCFALRATASANAVLVRSEACRTSSTGPAEIAGTVFIDSTLPLLNRLR